MSLHGRLHRLLKPASSAQRFMRVEVSEADGAHLPNSVTTPNKRQQLPAEYDRTNRANQVSVFAEIRGFPHHHWNCGELSVCPNQKSLKNMLCCCIPVQWRRGSILQQALWRIAPSCAKSAVVSDEADRDGCLRLQLRSGDFDTGRSLFDLTEQSSSGSLSCR